MSRKCVERHGDTRGNGWRASEYSIWVGMIQRCHNKRAPSYVYYGARGIEVCERWRTSYSNFLEDVGRRPSPVHTIERVNNDGNYEPANVRWVLPEIQARNRRGNHKVVAFGRERCVVDWAKDLGAAPSTIVSRLKRGWIPEDAVSIPPDEHADYAITVRGKTLSLLGWAKESGMATTTIRHRIVKGWLPEEAIFGRPGSRGTGRTRTVMLTVKGVTRTLLEWAETVGLGRSTIEERLKRGRTPEEAVNPIRGSGGRSRLGRAAP